MTNGNSTIPSLPFFIAPASDPRDRFAAGYDGNGFETREEAEAAIADVVAAFPDTTDADWVVSEA